ncbi:MAG TPA: glycosyltransferase 87 family protein [Micromonosporaceae bacterium]
MGVAGRVRILVVVGLAGAVTAFLSVAAAGHGFFDLEIYYGAMRHWVRDGGVLYDWLKRDTRYGFTYPPFAAVLMLPLAYLPWPVVVVAYLAATAAAIGLLLRWLVAPICGRMGWPRWFVLAIALLLAAAFEPLTETVDFGQINMFLLLVVAGDLLWPVARGSRWGGVGIGLATAVKLTPGIFIAYLLVTGRWRAALAAGATVAGAGLWAAALVPHTSREFWLVALWNTDRVGELEFVSNQSLRGMVARLAPAQPELWWLPLVAVVGAVWVWRVRAAAAARDETAGLALTGVAMCLLSPVTWVHHLVWLIPALVLVVDHAFRAPVASRRRRIRLGLACLAYVGLSSRIVWLWEHDFSGLTGFLGSNAYLLVSVALLLAVPVRTAVEAKRAAVPGRRELVRLR